MVLSFIIMTSGFQVYLNSTYPLYQQQNICPNAGRATKFAETTFFKPTDMRNHLLNKLTALLLLVAGAMTVTTASAEMKNASPECRTAKTAQASPLLSATKKADAAASKKGTSATKAGISAKLDMAKTETIVCAPAFPAKAATQSKWWNVKVELNYDEAIYSPQGGVIANEEGGAQLYPDWETGEISSAVPAGSYALVYAFQKNDENGVKIGDVFVIKENIDITADTTIEINPAEATEHLHFIPVKANGEELVLPEKRFIFDENWNATEELLSEGNVDFICTTMNPYNKKIGTLIYLQAGCSSTSELFYPTGEYEYSTITTDYWFSPVSDEWLPIMNVAFGADDTNSYCIMTADSINTAEITNNASNYTEFPYPAYQQSYFGQIQEWQPKQIITPDVFTEFDRKSIYTPNYSMNHYLDDYGENYNKFLFSDNSEPTIKEKLMHMVRIMRYDAVASHETDTIWLDEENFRLATYESYSAFTYPPFYITSNGIREVQYCEDCYFYSYDDPSNYNLYDYCWHPWLPTQTDKDYITYGSTLNYVETFVSGFHNRQGNGLGTYTYIKDFYAGYNSTNTLFGEWNIMYNGDVKATHEEYGWFPDEGAWAIDKMNLPAGEFTLNYKTPLEMVEGLEGYTTLSATIDQKNSESIAPAIRYLTMVTTDGMFTNRFATPEEAILRIVGGDFDWDDASNLPCNSEADVVVEVSPYALNDWQIIDMEIQDVEAPVNMGSAYQGSLASLTTGSESGWFDLKVSMGDAAGNTMTQTISPAFKIDSLNTGIAPAISNATDIRMMGNTIIAPAGSRIMTLAGTPSSGRDLAPGIYIVVTPSATRKIIIR